MEMSFPSLPPEEMEQPLQNEWNGGKAALLQGNGIILPSNTFVGSGKVRGERLKTFGYFKSSHCAIREPG